MTQQYKNIKELQSSVEKELLYYIIIHMKDRRLTVTQAQHLAKEYLSLLPAKNEDDLIQKLKVLAYKSSEAWKAFIKVGMPYLEQKKNKVLSAISADLKVGDIQHALILTKEGMIYG